MTRSHAILVVYLRGGADGLSLVPPLSEEAYHRARPSLSLAEGHADRSRRAIHAGGGFGLHPELAPLAGWLEDRSLSIVLGAGSDDDTRSHFEAQDRMELGQLGGAAAPSSGWMARALRAGTPEPSSLAAIALGRSLPEALRGAPATVVNDLRELVDGAPAEADLDQILALYEGAGDAPEETASEQEIRRALTDGARASVASLRTLRSLVGESPPEAQAFPNTEFGARLRTAALLLSHREELGVRLISVDQGGWDTHFGQAPLLAENANDLARSLAALRSSLDAQSDAAWDQTTVLVMTEFGRRVAENVSLGTDHGRASTVFIAGGSLPWAPLLGQWPSLDSLEGPGDLPVTTNVRDVIAEVMKSRAGIDSSRVMDGPLSVLRALS